MADRRHCQSAGPDSPDGSFLHMIGDVCSVRDQDLCLITTIADVFMGNVVVSAIVIPMLTRHYRFALGTNWTIDYEVTRSVWRLRHAPQKRNRDPELVLAPDGSNGAF